MFWCIVLLHIISLFTLLFTVGGVSLSVAQNGSDNETCLHGVTACESLDYVLRNLASISDIQVDIDVEYDQMISTKAVTVQANQLLNISGVNFPTISASNDGNEITVIT